MNRNLTIQQKAEIYDLMEFMGKQHIPFEFDGKEVTVFWGEWHGHYMFGFAGACEIKRLKEAVVYIYEDIMENTETLTHEQAKEEDIDHLTWFMQGLGTKENKRRRFIPQFEINEEKRFINRLKSELEADNINK